MPMHLRIQTPTGVFLDRDDVRRLGIQTPDGGFGFRPRRLDGVFPLVPGLLMYEAEEERYVAVDEGLLIKTGPRVLVSVHRAFGGRLAELEALIEREFRERRADDLRVRQALATLEGQFVRHVLEVGHEA